MSGGFSEISFQVVTLLAFQVIYGYVYYKLGIILTSFMIGLALGSWVINRTFPRIKNIERLFFKTQLAITIYPLFLPAIFFTFAHWPKLAFLGNNVILPYLPLIAGFIGGVQFPLANKIYLKRRNNLGTAVGITYGTDLLGACIGALLISVFVLPIMGITRTCIVTAIINLSALIIIWKHHYVSRHNR